MTSLIHSARRIDGPSRGIHRLQPLAAPGLVGLLGLAISLLGIGTPSIWYDEAATLTAATRDWDQLWAMTANVDAVHAAYYAVMHVVFDIFGYTPLTLRVPSAIAVGIAAALTVVLGRTLDRARLGLIAGIVFCLLPRTTWAGTEGRSYALTAVLALTMTILLVLAARSSRRILWALYALAVVVSCLVFVYLAIVVAAHAVTMAWWFASSRSRAWPPAARWVRWTALATALVVPFGIAVIGQSGQVHWLKPPGLRTVREVFENQWFYTSTPFAVVGWALILAGAIVLLRSARGLSPASVLLPALVLPTVALLVLSVAVTPVYTPRYLTMCVPFVALVMAAAIDRMRPTPLATAAVLVLALLAVPQIAAQRLPEAKERASWAAVADLIAEQRALDGPRSTTAIVYGAVQRHPSATSRVMAVAYPDAFADTIDVTLGTPAAETGQLWETRIPLSEGLHRLRGVDAVYLVTSVARDQRPATTDTLTTAGWHVEDAWSLTAVNIVKYERD